MSNGVEFKTPLNFTEEIVGIWFYLKRIMNIMFCILKNLGFTYTLFTREPKTIVHHFGCQLSVPKVACDIVTNIHPITHIAFPTSLVYVRLHCCLFITQFAGALSVSRLVYVRLPPIAFSARHLCFLCDFSAS